MGFWIYPMKPMRINESLLSSLKLGDYILEKKYDGFRALLIVDEHGFKLMTRQRTELAIPNNLRPQIEALKLPPGTVLDGELWTPSKRGSWRHDKSVVCSLAFWDVMAFDGKSVGAMPLEDRRAIMEKLLGRGTEDIKPVEWEEVTPARIEEIRKEAMEHRVASQSRSGFVHGVVLKRKGSPRRDNPSRSVEHADWMKIVYWAQN
jgi:ATP-dependent DNA ligase